MAYKNREDKLEYDRNYNQTHKLEKNEYWKTHKSEVAERDRIYYQTHKLYKNEYDREYHLSHKLELVKYRQAHKVEAANKQFQKQLQLKVEVLTYYGNSRCACVRCRFDDIRALSIDHINGGGNKQRQKENVGSNPYRWLKKKNFPAGYQTLCMNCQFIKRVENNECANIKNHEATS